MNNLNPQTILARICSEYGITPQTLASPTRKATVSEARQMLCYILIYKLDTPETEISEMIGGRTTARYLANEGRIRMKVYPAARGIYDRVYLRGE